jgi:hypothetical protein
MAGSLQFDGSIMAEHHIDRLQAWPLDGFFEIGQVSKVILGDGHATSKVELNCILNEIPQPTTDSGLLKRHEQVAQAETLHATIHAGPTVRRVNLNFGRV